MGIFTLRFNVLTFIALLLVLSLIIKLNINFHNDVHIAYNAKRKVEWREPAALKVEFPTPIGNKVWVQEYHQIEKILWRAKADPHNNLIINSETLALLQQAAALLLEDLSDKELERLNHVLNKSIPGGKGLELARLLICYASYEHHYKANVVAINSVKGRDKKKLLMANEKVSEELQIRFFGKEKAQKIFSKQNKTLNYFNQRSLINMTEELSLIQKKQQLLLLQKAYQTSINEQ